MDKETLIARLIVSYLCGEMSDKTKDYERLQAWVGARASHRRLFQELCSLEAVKEDVRARETVDSKSALEDMRRRIRKQCFRERTPCYSNLVPFASLVGCCCDCFYRLIVRNRRLGILYPCVEVEGGGIDQSRSGTSATNQGWLH